MSASHPSSDRRALSAREIKERGDKRALQAAELRRAGLTFKEIGKHIGLHGPVTVETARAAVAKGERILARRAKQSDTQRCRHCGGEIPCGC